MLTFAFAGFPPPRPGAAPWKTSCLTCAQFYFFTFYIFLYFYIMEWLLTFLGFLFQSKFFGHVGEYWSTNVPAIEKTNRQIITFLFLTLDLLGPKEHWWTIKYKCVWYDSNNFEEEKAPVCHYWLEPAPSSLSTRPHHHCRGLLATPGLRD